MLYGSFELMERSDRNRMARIALSGLIVLFIGGLALAQSAAPPPPVTPVPASVPTSSPAPVPASTPAPTPNPTPASVSVPTAQEYYGLWVLIPPLVAIVLAVVTRQVVAALFVAIVVASYMLLPCRGQEASLADSNFVFQGLGFVVDGFRVTVETYIIGSIADRGHIQIIIFTLTIGAMVGVIGANGGTRSIVEVLSRWANTSRRGQLAGWAGGHVVFFDDYANTMILGPTLGPLYDRLRISRAKLAYIVDSTAAPVSSLAPIGTWIGAEIGYIQDGLNNVAKSTPAVPEFLNGINGYSVFLASIGYRFYAIFALALVLIIALTRRDFGPMKRAERRAHWDVQEQGGSGLCPSCDGLVVGEASFCPSCGQALVMGGSVRAQGVGGRWWYAFSPVALMVLLTITILLITGVQGFPQDKAMSLGAMPDLLKNADANSSILYGALAGLILAVAISVVSKTLKLRMAMNAALDGMSRMFPAIVILTLAWALSEATQKLMLGEVVSSQLQSRSFDPIYLPLAVFGAACLVSFATGTSWGTMGILCPVAVEVAAKLCGDLPIEQARPLFYSAVGAVLAGAIFGDHCSPISDTTVLSSLASSCTLERHVWTQLPYALLAALVSVAAGHVLCNTYGQPWWVGILAGIAALLLIMWIVGRRPPQPSQAPVAVGEPEVQSEEPSDLPE